MDRYPQSEIIAQRTPNNNDATFKDPTQDSKPAELLLHYMYGTAAVKQWGKKTSVLTSYPDVPRPSVPAVAPIRPINIAHDPNIARFDTVIQGEEGAGRVARFKAQDNLDADDIMLFFWGNQGGYRVLGGLESCGSGLAL